MADISAFGLRINVRADKTFPNGFDLTAFADDADAFDAPSTQVKDKAMGINGHLITWGKANALMATINVIPNTDDDRNLAILLDANRVTKGKAYVNDTITMTVSYPNGNVTTFSGGAITDGQPANGAASSGRIKTKAYQFAFESRSGA